MMKITVERFIPNAGMGMELELEHMHRYLAVAPMLKDMRVLDAACGVGYGSAIIAEYADSVIGIDIDSETVDYASKKYKCDNLSFMKMSISELTFPDGYFDAVISYETIEHVSEQLQKDYLSQVRRVLKPNGFFVVSTPDYDVFMRRSRGTYSNPFHIKEYNLTDFKSLLSQYFPYVTLHRQGKVRCSIIDGEGSALLNKAPENMEGEYIIAVCSFQEKKVPLGSAYQSKEIDGAIMSTLYFDYGSWYSDSTKKNIPLMTDVDGRFYVDLHISENPECRAVRFDPVEGTGCIIRNFKVVIDGQNCAFTALNAVSDGNDLLFVNTDPQIEIAIPSGANRIELFGSISILTAAETINHALLMKNRQLKDMSERVDQLIQKNAVLDNRLNEILADQNVLLSQHQKQLDERDGIMAQQKSLISQQSGEIAQHLNVIAQQQNQITERDTVIAQQRYQLTVLQNCYNTINEAFFWRITAPLRHMLDVLKKKQWIFMFDKGLHSLKSFGFKATWAKVKAYRTKKTSKVYAAAADAQVDAQSEVTLHAFVEHCKAAGGEVYDEHLLFQHDTKEMVLLVSHELNLTGAPIALQYFAESLQRQGMFPVIIAPHDDTLRPQLTEEGIPVLTHPAMYQSSVVTDYAPLFSLIVLNTNGGAPIAAQLSGSDIPVLWWIHEAHASYYPGALAAMPMTLGKNIHVYCGGTWAQNILHQYRPTYETDILLYCVPDLACMAHESNFTLENSVEKTVFACVGALEERKGQDILVEAIRRLSGKEREKSVFVFVGREYHPPIIKAIRSLCEDYPENVRYIPELKKNDLYALYDRMDCLICSSKDDPMPVVVTDALTLSKCVICSENTGSAALLQEMDSGFVYHNNDAGELAECISRLLSGRVDTSRVAIAARKTYEKNFSPEVFDRNTSVLCNRFIASPRTPLTQKVSVVIPTYNAGAELKPLLENLIAQRGIGTLELVIVDSGSTDGTPDIARAYGAKLIEIPQEKFSHSYARNLGVEAATGEFVMMMTQDAVPNGDYWLWKMAQPIVKNGVVAVSCRQTPKPGCDLLGRLSLYIHIDYMGIMDHDRVLSLPKSHDYDSLRKNGQLDDVACMFKREIFLQFRYRGNYAEDLDIGLRLIHAGYRLALLSSASVIHSHTRPAYYHLKRGVVDVSALKRILPDFPVHTERSSVCLDRIITSYVAGKMFAESLLLGSVPSEKDELQEWVNAEFERIRAQMREMSPEGFRREIECDTAYTDRKFQKLVLDFLEKRSKSFHADSTCTYDQAYYITMHVLPFLARESGAIGEEGRQEIAEVTEKHSAQLAGNLLAGYVVNHHGEDPYLDEVCRVLSNGV